MLCAKRLLSSPAAKSPPPRQFSHPPSNCTPTSFSSSVFGAQSFFSFVNFSFENVAVGIFLVFSEDLDLPPVVEGDSVATKALVPFSFSSVFS